MRTIYITTAPLEGKCSPPLQENRIESYVGTSWHWAG